MKKLLLSLSTASFLTFSSFQKDITYTNAPVVGEWDNVNRDEVLKKFKFFPNGMLNVIVGNHNCIAKYKVNRVDELNEFSISGNITAANAISFANGGQSAIKNNAGYAVPFTATIKKGRLMDMDIRDDSRIKHISLIKVRNINAGAILAK